MPTNINVNSVPAGSEVYINGFVEYSHISSHIDGAALDADNQRKIARGIRPIDKPHARLSIKNVSIVYADPNAPTIAEQYIAERLFTYKEHPERGLCFTALNKSKNLPELYCRTDINSKSLEQVPNNGKEIATDVSVTILMRFFSTQMNNGVSLDAVIVNEKPVRWIGQRSTSGILASRGFEISSESTSVDSVRAQLNAPGYAAPAPVAPAPVAPAPAPYMAAPAPAPVAPAPVAPAPIVTPIPAPVAAPVQTAAVAGTAPSLPVPPKGYQYDDAGRLVPIPATGGIKL